MQIIQQGVEDWGYCPSDYQGSMELIERCARLCYQFEANITDGITMNWACFRIPVAIKS